MARVLTQLIVERFNPPTSGRVVHWDALVPGFGLRISDKNSRSWIAMYRVKGKTVMQTLGSLALIPKVDDARQHAREAIIRARSGVNPVEEKRAEEASAEAEQVTFAAVADRWMREYVERNCSESLTRERRRTLGYDILPRWGERPAREITKSDVNDLLDLKAERRDRARKGRTDGAGVQSNRTFSLLKRLLLEGGGGSNGAFLRAGLIDEISLAICPAVDGAKGAPSSLDSSDGDAGVHGAVQLGGQPGSRLHQSDRRCTAPRQGGAARPAARR